MAKEIFYLRSNLGVIFRACERASYLYPNGVFVDVWGGDEWYKNSVYENWERWEYYALKSEKIIAIVRIKMKK